MQNGVKNGKQCGVRESVKQFEYFDDSIYNSTECIVSTKQIKKDCTMWELLLH